MPIVVFPAVPVLIRHSGGSTVSSPNLAMLYNPQTLFERELRDPRGDHCLVVELTELVRGELVDGEFRQIVAPVSASAYLVRHRLGRYLRTEGCDPVAIEELTLALLRGTVHAREPRHNGTHRALAESAKELLWHTLTDDVRVAELACRLAVSPFHLTRVFREQTGFALYEYRLQLRLRRALERLAEGETSITALAHELGFSSHSHLTNQFRRHFGIAPSAARTIVQAAGFPRP